MCDPDHRATAAAAAELSELEIDGRMSYKDLGERIGLTAPAVAERIRKLEEAGVIRGYRAVKATDAGRDS